MPCLKEVNLSSNKIKQVEYKGANGTPQDGGSFQNLEDIDIYNNKITHFMPDTFIQLKQLVQLNLSQNKLTKIQIQRPSPTSQTQFVI